MIISLLYLIEEKKSKNIKLFIHFCANFQKKYENFFFKMSMNAEIYRIHITACFIRYILLSKKYLEKLLIAEICSFFWLMKTKLP